MKNLVIILLGAGIIIAVQAQFNNAQSLLGKWEFSGGMIEFRQDGSGVMILKNVNRGAVCP